MEENKKLAWIAGISVAVLVVVWWFYEQEKKKNIKITKHNKELQKHLIMYSERMNQLEEMIKSDDSIDTELKQNILNLMNEYDGIAPEVSGELSSILLLVQNKQHSKAALSLTKIIENLLKSRFDKDEKFLVYLSGLNKKKGSNIVFNDFLEYAKKDGLLSKDEYHFAKGLKEIRNQEAHELNVQKESSFARSFLNIGIFLILKLTSSFNY